MGPAAGRWTDNVKLTGPAQTAGNCSAGAAMTNTVKGLARQPAGAARPSSLCSAKLGRLELGLFIEGANRSG